QTCTWAIGNGAGETLDVGPGSYTFEFTVVDDDGRSSVATSTLTVLPEDARAYYIGPDFAAAAPEDGLLAFELRAIVRDISAEPPAIPEWDPDPGDVTHAFVTFVDRGTGAVLCSAPVQLVFPGLRTLGDAWCTWYVDPAALPDGFESFRIGIVVGGWYHRDDPADDATVLVSGPMKGSLDGGGWVRLANAAGAFAPDPDTKVKIELEAKFRHLQKDEDGDEEDERKKDHEKKHRPELEGKVKIRFTSHGVEYEIETMSLSSLGLACPDPALGPAVGQLEAVAVLKTKGRKHDDHDDHDGHDNDGGIVAAGLRLQIRAGDAEHHHSDTVGFTLWSPTGELLLSSDWTGVGTAETLLGGGGFEVHLPKGEPKKCGPDDHDEHDEHDSSDGHKEAVRPKD
ncbi:MAG: hypothetical protein ACE5EF_11035, partial [Dehalococcoidia bacterium]